MRLRLCVTWISLGLLACVDAASRSPADTAAADTIPASTDGSDSDSSTGDTGTVLGDFGPEQSFELRLQESTPPPLTLSMNRDEVAELFGDRAGDILLLELDPTTLLTEALERIKHACGENWQQDNENPHHDCSLTPLGQTFAGPDGTWQTSPEYALVRILTMTPANVVVDGTSSESLRAVADFLNVGGGYSEILAQVLGIPRTQSVVSTPGLVQALHEHFVGTHPNISADGKLGITLQDALSDLASLSDRYGPIDDHPGIIDPSLMPHGEVLAADFHMSVVAESNLRVVDGVDASTGKKGFMSVVVDSTGPTYDDEIEFDFTNENTFSITGLVEDPHVDLRFSTGEATKFVSSCLGNPPCQGNTIESPVGSESVWALDPWMLEYDIAAGAYNDYHARTFHGSYLLGSANIDLGQDGAPPGWLTYDILLNLGSPPEDQYVWETILEVAQVALHNPPTATFPEGSIKVAFTLEDVPVGLSGAEAAQAVRPYLQEQASELSDVLLGDYEKNNDPVDVFYRRGENGIPYLFFVAASDMLDPSDYAYAKPGFFSDPRLTADSQTSRTEMSGVADQIHHKLELPVGETITYFADNGGTVFRARVVREANDDTVTVFIAAKEE